MLEHVKVENFKSIEVLPLELGRVNIFIGENGSGKSNILEAIALAAAAEAGKLDNEFLASRGVRVSSPKLMRSAFKASRASEAIVVTGNWSDGSNLRYELNNDNKPYSSWTSSTNVSLQESSLASVEDRFKNVIGKIKTPEERRRVLDDLLRQLNEMLHGVEPTGKGNDDADGISSIELTIRTNEKVHYSDNLSSFANFIIYSPENSALRTYEREGQIEPLGIYGEGLLRFIEVLSSEGDKGTFEEIKTNLELFSWYKDLNYNPSRAQNKIKITDKFLDKRFSGFDQRSANEGFLFVAFYIALLTSKITPRFFAIDNVDSALNPKLCQELVKRIVAISKTHDKQVLLTTHNPACLDGLDLNDEEQRLFIVSRSSEGKTRVRRFHKKPSPGQPSRLSELFIRGALGGLPQGF